ncbi:MAG: hypothetical protein ACSHWZ_07640 [Sulfitobacter sp.]
MRQLLFLLLLVPIHLATGAMVASFVKAVTPLDALAAQWVVVPVYLLLSAVVCTFYLDRIVIREKEKAEFFRLKVMLGNLFWPGFLIWVKLLVIYLGVMQPVETDFISAALLVIGTALMIQFFWTARNHRGKNKG